MEKGFLKRGVCDCKIVLPKNAHTVEKTAAEELSKYIEKALSVKLPIICECEASGKCIYVGTTDFAKASNVVGKEVENWIIKMQGESLIITGGEYRGIIYAAYHFIEDFLGVRWWSPYEEDILELSDLSLPEDLYREGTPHFCHRGVYLQKAGPEGFHYLVKSRINAISPYDDDIPDGVCDETVKKFGGAKWAGRPHHVHTIEKYFPPKETYAAHPEWFAWNEVQNKHIGEGNFCFSNKEFFDAFLEKILAYVKEDVEVSERENVAFPSYYSISIGDYGTEFFCQCDECKKKIAEKGYSGYGLDFVNRLAREVAKQYPQAKLEFLVYLNYIELPKDGTLPEKNVVIRLADLVSDMGRGIHARTNANYLRLMGDWSGACKKAGSELYVYDYLYNIRLNYALPLFYRIKDMVNTYCEYGVKGFFIEAQNSDADCWDINKYVLTHLLEDPSIDEVNLIDDAIKRYFGPAAGYVKEYLELMRSTLEKNEIKVFCCAEDSRFNYVDLNSAIKGSGLLDRAKGAVRGDKKFEPRVNWLRRALDAAILMRFFEFKAQAEREGTPFSFDIKEIKSRIAAAYDEHSTSPGFKAAKEYLLGLPEEPMTFDIPKELANENSDDIFQFSLCNMPKYVQEYMKVAFGYSVVKDEDSACSEVIKLSFDEAKGIHKLTAWYPTLRNAEKKSSLYFGLQQEAKDVTALEVYKDDIVQGGYHLYKIGTISNIRESTNVRAKLPGGIGSINLKAIALSFPMDACDVYVSMKCTGELYGGNPKDENAMYFERMIIVRR